MILPSGAMACQRTPTVCARGNHVPPVEGDKAIAAKPLGDSRAQRYKMMEHHEIRQ